MLTLWVFIVFILLVVVFFEFIYPFKVLEVEECPKEGRVSKKGKTFVVHVHTYHSYDSLGKPEEIEIAAQKLNIDKVFITDHNNSLIKFYKSPLIVPGVEYQDSIYGRILKLDNTFIVIAHPNNSRKEEYAWRGKYKKDFFYELIDLKDVIYASPAILKLYFSIRFLLFYPFLGLRALDFFPKLVPIFKWVGLYLQRTSGVLKVIGGLDHHVKLSIWEKPKKFFSFPPYLWSFYILSNKTFEGEVTESLHSGEFYISLCQFEVSKWKQELCYKGKNILTFNYFGNCSYKVNNCGRIAEDATLIVLFKYSFRLGKVYFGLMPVCIYKPTEGNLGG